MGNTRVNRRLESFYGEVTSVDAILRALARDGPEENKVTAADLYTRSLDCQNIGGFAMLERHAALATLTELVGLGDRVAYLQVDATSLPCAAHQFDQAWMLDVSIHIANKAVLFGELARVVKADGLLVLHDQLGPLPPAMRSVTRRAPYIAPALPQLLRYIEGAGFRVLTWRDTTDTALAYMQERREGLLQGV